MEYKYLGKQLDRQNYFKNIALKATEHCLKTFDSNELSEVEEKCLKRAALNLHFIVERNKFEQYTILGHPPHPW
jgi:hypothetical protein